MAEQVEIGAYQVLTQPLKTSPSLAPASWWESLAAIAAVVLGRELFLSNICGLVLGRIVLFDSLSPFGIAFYSTLLMTGQQRRAWGALIGVLLGLLTLGKAREIIFHLVVFLSLYGLIRKKRSSALWVMLTVGMARLSLSFLWNGTWQAGFGLEAVLAALLCGVLGPVAILWAGDRPRVLSSQQLAALAMFAAGLVAGLHGWQVGGIALDGVAGKAAVLVGAQVGGGGLGAAVGVTVGALAAVSSSGDPYLISVLALGGLLAGLGQRLGKPGTAVGFILGLFILSAQTPGEDLLFDSLRHTGLALLLFSLVPGAYLQQAAQIIPGTIQQLRSQRKQEERFQRTLAQKLTDVSCMFADLSDKCLIRPPEDTNPMDSFLERLGEKACSRCPSYNRCWDESFLQNYWDLIAILAALEKPGTKIPKTNLGSRCIRRQAFLEAIGEVLKTMRLEEHWRQRLKDSQRLIAGQLQGVAEIMGSLAGQLKIQVDYADEAEIGLAQRLAGARVNCSEVMVRRLDNDLLEVIIHKSPCRGRESLCGARIPDLVTRQLGRSYMLKRQGPCPRTNGARACELTLLPKEEYTLGIQVLTVAKDGKTVSGDHHGQVELSGGKTAIILSDGMGAGSAAALESVTTVSLLTRMLEAGFDHRYALRLVNTMLLLRSPEETFATIDLVIIDRYTGEAEFIKVGAPSSLIKRGSQVEVLSPGSPPAGILSEIDIQVEKRCLRPDDVVVLFTDGLLDVRGESNKEEWLTQVLAQLDDTEPAHVGQGLLKAAQVGEGGRFPDDVTLIVLRLERNTSAGRTAWAIRPYGQRRGKTAG
ncbi:MAG: stage II sporulation protein E [Firmicutes bacterium]|nr:stage II sporulation protein E [Bacillota bacterium]